MTAYEYETWYGISRLAALAIVDYRNGDDILSPHDDRRFRTLYDLDALPFTDAAFWQTMKAAAHPPPPPSPPCSCTPSGECSCCYPDPDAGGYCSPDPGFPAPSPGEPLPQQ